MSVAHILKHKGRDVITVTPDTPLKDIADTLAKHDDVAAHWYFGSPEGSAKIERESAGNLKSTWVSHGHARDWFDAGQGQADGHGLTGHAQGGATDDGRGFGEAIAFGQDGLAEFEFEAARIGARRGQGAAQGVLDIATPKLDR